MCGCFIDLDEWLEMDLVIESSSWRERDCARRELWRSVGIGWSGFQCHRYENIERFFFNKIFDDIIFIAVQHPISATWKKEF